MNLYLLFIICSSLLGIKVFFKGFNKDYLSKENSTNIKGIFVLIIFYSHLVPYTKVLLTKDFAMYNFRNWLDQLMVTLFLFYSGYGIYESIKQKKSQYIDSMPRNRILKTWLNLALCIIIFIIFNQFLSISYSKKDILLAFTGWTSIGNSNWYIMAILLLYLETYLSFKIFAKDNKKAIGLTTFLTIIQILFMHSHQPYYTYNTLLCYPLGLIYSYNKDKINKLLMNSNKTYLYTLIISIITTLIIKEYEKVSYIYYLLLSISFTISIVLISMKINFNSFILKWFGDNLFWIYMLQRIPMILFKKLGFATRPYKYALICFATTIVISIIIKFISQRINSLLFKKQVH